MKLLSVLPVAVMKYTTETGAGGIGGMHHCTIASTILNTKFINKLAARVYMAWRRYTADSTTI